MTEIDYELMLICTTPSAFGTSPKYDMKIIHNHFILDGRIWGRKIGSPRAEVSEVESAVDEMVASRELYGLSEEEVRIVEGKS